MTSRSGPWPGDCTVYNKRAQCVVRGAPKWRVCVKGETDSGCDYVDVTTYTRCAEGKPWPACKEKS